MVSLLQHVSVNFHNLISVARLGIYIYVLFVHYKLFLSKRFECFYSSLACSSHKLTFPH